MAQDYNVELNRYNGSDYDKLLPRNSKYGSSAPTTSTVGHIGQFYADTTHKRVYVCMAQSGNTYTWVLVSALSDDTPKPLGSASAGTSSYGARADHIHAKPSLTDLGAQKTISSGTSSPSGGSNGDIYIQY